MISRLTPLFALAVLPAAARAAPEPSSSMVEIGVSAGAFMASPDHELYDSTAHRQVALADAAPDLGLRFAFFPLSFLGAEAEGQFVPVTTITDRNAYVMAFRAHGMLQYPGRITPFVVAGGGTLGLSSGSAALGSDFDRAFHWGLGAKWWLNDRFTMRVDGRHIISGGRGDGDGNTSHFEVTVGLGLALWKADDPLPIQAPIDSPIRIVADEPAPEPEVLEPIAPPTVVEQVAAAMQMAEREVVEVLDRVHFAWGSAALRAGDHVFLDDAVLLLGRYPTLQVEVIGHTDSTGPHRFNMGLSRRRAAVVRDYLVSKGVEPERISTQGAGPDTPIASNHTRDGRARNRRIEFTVRHSDGAKVRLEMRDAEEAAAEHGVRP